jgi:hypothetical protein
MLVMTLNSSEGFLSDAEIKQRASELHNNRDMFVPNVKYGQIKQKISWIDPVVFDDAYHMNLKKDPTISDLENIFK